MGPTFAAMRVPRRVPIPSAVPDRDRVFYALWTTAAFLVVVWGVHALGGPLFDNKKPRLYVLSQNAALFEIDLNNYKSSPQLVLGPDLKLQTGYNGWSGLAGPLTDCMSLIPQ